MALDISGGDPAKEPASYTRFVLPFGYHPVRISPIRAGPIYQEVTPCTSEDAQRLHARNDYFTAETSAVLYERAKWMELADASNGTPSGPRDFQAKGRRVDGDGRKRLKVRLMPPRLVLFEWPDAEPTAAEPDLLASGFLVQEACFLEDSGR